MVDSVAPTPAQAVNTNVYVPGSAEKKKCIMMYVGLGIILSVARNDMSDFESFHFRQSIGRWLVFVLVLLVVIVLLFLPIIWILGRLLLIAMLVVAAMFVKQAWNGQYSNNIDGIWMPLFVGVGGWALQIFDINVQKKGEDTEQ